MLAAQLAVAQEWLGNNWQGLLMVWGATTVLFWLMGGFTPAIAAAPMRMRRELEVTLHPFQPSRDCC